MEDKKIKQIISINVYGKNKTDLKNKVKKIYFLVSFLKDSKWKKIYQFIFILFISLFLTYIFFWIYISGFNVYSNKYINWITKEAYIYDINKKPYIIEKKKITSCWLMYCILDDWKPIEKALINKYIIK